MPYTVWLLGPRSKLLDTVEAPLPTIIGKLLDYWPEEFAPVCLGILDAADVVVCVLMRDNSDPGTCHIQYVDGKQQSYATAYRFDDDKGFVGTEIVDQGEDPRWELRYSVPSCN